MIPVPEARSSVLAHCRALPPGLKAVQDALGLVLAGTVRAVRPVPAFASSTMDGYARGRRYSGGTRPLARRGHGDGRPRRACCRRRRGRRPHHDRRERMPRGRDAVWGSSSPDGAGRLGGCIDERVGGCERAGAGERHRSERRSPRPGDRAHPAPYRGAGRPRRRDRPRPPSPPCRGWSPPATNLPPCPGPAPGRDPDSNRPALLAQLRVDGFDPVDLGTVGDDESTVKDVLESAGTGSDAFITTGGVSVGDRDPVNAALRSLCGENTWSEQVAVKPAKPFAFGTLTSTRAPVFGLPGNPVAALVSYELFARPALRAMAGHHALDRPRFTAITEDDLTRRRDGKLHLVRVQAFVGADGALRARLLGGQGSHMLRAMADANALAVLPDGDGVQVGGQVDVLVLDVDRLCPPGYERPW